MGMTNSKSHDPRAARSSGTTRRGFLAAAAASVAACRNPGASPAQDGAPPLAASSAPPSVPSLLGRGRRGYGERSSFEKAERSFRPSATPGTGSSKTPLASLVGIITPSSLHFERLHSGVPSIDPAKHELLVHGLVEKPLVFTLDDLRRLPSVSRVHFIECAGNSGREHQGQPHEDVQKSHGLLGCSEWTGVLLSVLLREAGLRNGAKWLVAEGADAGRLARSIPLEKALDDVIVAYGQNGEALRPEQGYPIRLVVPGWEGNVNVKWIRRIHVVDQPYMTREEAPYYTDLMADGKARMFTFVMEAKSVITRPSGGMKLAGPGFHEITGLAWSGRGRITRVDISTDGGKTWAPARLDDPALPKALTRFHFPWTWRGEDTWLLSRCTDETGYVQPTREQLVAVRGIHGTDHYNGIKAWRVLPGGEVRHV